MKKNILQKVERIKFIEQVKKFIADHPEPMSYKTLSEALNKDGNSYFDNPQHRTKQGLQNKIDKCGYKMVLEFKLRLEKKVTITNQRKKEIAEKMRTAEDEDN